MATQAAGIAGSVLAALAGAEEDLAGEAGVGADRGLDSDCGTRSGSIHGGVRPLLVTVITQTRIIPYMVIPTRVITIQTITRRRRREAINTTRSKIRGDTTKPLPMAIGLRQMGQAPQWDPIPQAWPFRS